MKRSRIDEKGFSLVELIIVISIIAILVGMIGLQVVPYIEKSRLSKDMQLVDAVFVAWQNAVAKEHTQSNGGTGVLLGSGLSAFVETNHQSDNDYDLYSEICSDLGAGVTDAASLKAKLTSKALKGADIKFYYDRESGVIAVQACDGATSSYYISSDKGDRLKSGAAETPANLGILH